MKNYAATQLITYFKNKVYKWIISFWTSWIFIHHPQADSQSQESSKVWKSEYKMKSYRTANYVLRALKPRMNPELHHINIKTAAMPPNFLKHLRIYISIAYTNLTHLMELFHPCFNLLTVDARAWSKYKVKPEKTDKMYTFLTTYTNMSLKFHRSSSTIVTKMGILHLSLWCK